MTKQELTGSSLNLASTWFPTIVTVCSLVYFLGMRDQSQDIDAETIKQLESKVDTMVINSIDTKHKVDTMSVQFAEFKEEMKTFGAVRQDVNCLKNAFKTGGDPSKC